MSGVSTEQRPAGSSNLVVKLSGIKYNYKPYGSLNRVSWLKAMPIQPRIAHPLSTSLLQSFRLTLGLPWMITLQCPSQQCHHYHLDRLVEESSLSFHLTRSCTCAAHHLFCTAVSFTLLIELALLLFRVPQAPMHHFDLIGKVAFGPLVSTPGSQGLEETAQCTDRPATAWAYIHGDGHPKLVRWHFVTHCEIDGCSRMVSIPPQTTEHQPFTFL